MGRKIRIGIDVGGTFTDAIALDNETYEIIGLKKVPTTHAAAEGVTKGVIQVLHDLLDEIKASPDEIIFIAHGTTQATNALLEGDVTDVGIIGMGSGLGAFKANSDTNLGEISLEGENNSSSEHKKVIKTKQVFINTTSGLDQELIKEALRQFKKEKINVVVASEAFAVDDPDNELKIEEFCNQKGFISTGSHEISKLYGLKARTRTGVINASILPKMMQTADMTSKAVEEANIKVPLMIMRSDGGVMLIEEVKKRPILTVLSGPAAGVAGALMYEKISDGIFLEVGGTSTDISAIQNGKVITEYAEIGGHKTYVNSLDINTIGIAGGSMIRFKSKGITNVGPRSAHISGLNYAIYAKPGELEGAKVINVKPLPEDPNDYLALETKSGHRYAVTLTCTANYLGYIKEGDYAYGDQENARAIFRILEKEFGQSAEKIAEKIISLAVQKVIPTVQQFIKKNNLNEDYLVLTGGGGGCGAIVPALAEKMGLKYKIAKNASVISTIGAALAMVRDTIEKTIINPEKEDILRIRKEAELAVIKAGANPNTVQVTIDIDATKNIVKATAMGTTEFSSDRKIGKTYNVDELEDLIRQMVGNGVDMQINHVHSTDFLSVFEVKTIKPVFMNLFKKKKKALYVLDQQGIIKLQLDEGIPFIMTPLETESKLSYILPEYSKYDETGQRVPDVYLLISGKIIDLSGLDSIEQIISLSSLEVEAIDEKSKIVVIIKRR